MARFHTCYNFLFIVKNKLLKRVRTNSSHILTLFASWAQISILTQTFTLTPILNLSLSSLYTDVDLQIVTWLAFKLFA